MNQPRRSFRRAPATVAGASCKAGTSNYEDPKWASRGQANFASLKSVQVPKNILSLWISTHVCTTVGGEQPATIQDHNRNNTNDFDLDEHPFIIGVVVVAFAATQRREAFNFNESPRTNWQTPGDATWTSLGGNATTKSLHAESRLPPPAA